MRIRIKPSYFVGQVPASYYVLRQGAKASGSFMRVAGTWVASNTRANASRAFSTVLAAARFALTGADLRPGHRW
jgi:hypothetical protein